MLIGLLSPRYNGQVPEGLPKDSEPVKDFRANSS